MPRRIEVPWVEIDISTIFPALISGVDYVGLHLKTRVPGDDEDDYDDDDNMDALVIGLRFRYEANSLVNHTLSQDLDLSTFELVGNGGSVGTAISDTGVPTIAALDCGPL